MIRISKIFLFVTLAVLAVWQLPWCYAFLTTKAAPSRFVMYSSLLGDFILTRYEEGEGIVRRDVAGRAYSEAETDSLLPSDPLIMSSTSVFVYRFGAVTSPREMRRPVIVHFRACNSELAWTTLAVNLLMFSGSGTVPPPSAIF